MPRISASGNDLVLVTQGRMTSKEYVARLRERVRRRRATYYDGFGRGYAGGRRDAFDEFQHSLDAIRGDVYLWRIGEIDAETAMSEIRESLEEVGRIDEP